MTIRRKLIAGYGALVAISATAIAVSLVMDGRIQRDVIELSAHAHAEVLAAHRLSSAVSTVEFRLVQLAAAREQERTSGPAASDGQVRTARTGLDSALMAMRELVSRVPEPSADRASRSPSGTVAEQPELHVLGELRVAIDRIEVGARTLDANVETMSAADARRAARALLAEINREVAPRLQRLMQDAEGELASASHAFTTTMRATRRIGMAAVMAAILLVLLVGTYTDRMQSVLQDFNTTLEKTVKDRTAQLKQVIDAAPFGAAVYNLDPSGQLIFIDANRSAGRILHVDTAKFIGKTIEEAFPAIADTDLPARCRRAASDGVPAHVGPISYNEGGISGSFDLDLVPLGPNRMAVFFRDVTELVHAYDETLAGWSRAMDVRDRETEGHTQRVTETTLELARAMGVSETELVHIRWGALLHDIGKIGVPDSILLKPGPLTQEEWAIMRRHPDIAREMLAPIAFLKNALSIPHCHHERWDGTGYPRGLANDQIPLAARIFAVADVWDALRSHRPYHRPWPAEEAHAYIRAQAGYQFDPAVVEAFERLQIESKAQGQPSRLERAG